MQDSTIASGPPTATFDQNAVPDTTGVSEAFSTLPSSVLSQLEPWMIFTLILGVLAALVASLWLVYNYINNIRTTEIHRQTLYDAVFQARLRALTEMSGVAAPQPLREEETPAYLQAAHDQVKSRLETEKTLRSAALAKNPPDNKGAAEAERVIRELEEQLSGRLSEAAIASAKVRAEEAEAEERRIEEDLKKRAKKEAKALVPPSMTVAGMGITGSFFIELTAILTIIFGIILLGLVDVLGTREIAPILAAIAGYVLGKTASGPPTQAAQPLSAGDPARVSESGE